VESLESIGIYPVRKEADKKQSREENQNHSDFAFEFEQVSHPDKIAILPLISKKADYILNGESSGDRSKDLVSFTHEVIGWGNWLNEIKIAVEENQNELINKAAASLGVLHRTDSILSDVNPADCLPGIHHHQGSIGCWDKMKKANLEAFEKFAPDKVKEILEKPLIYSQEMPSGIPFESSRYFDLQQLKKWDSKKEYKDAELQDTPYLDLSKIPKFDAIIAIKASMGLGKTDAGLNCTKEAEKDSICSFWIAPRTKLNKQTVARAWEKGIKMFLVNEDDNLSLVLDGDSHLALCGESLHNLMVISKVKTFTLMKLQASLSSY
jgi:hypothetical protein